MQKLIDADVAIDHWQWQSHAGVSNRGRKWFRVYNPIDSIQKIDPSGKFVHQWVPELADANVEQMHQLALDDFNYPAAIIEHQQARKEALQILEPIKKAAQRRSPAKST